MEPRYKKGGHPCAFPSPVAVMEMQPLFQCQYQHDAAKINYEILQQWIQGKGRQPVQWSTLIDVLKKIQLSVLAKKIGDAI